MEFKSESAISNAEETVLQVWKLNFSKVLVKKYILEYKEILEEPCWIISEKS
jgi:hypothetical protein